MREGVEDPESALINTKADPLMESLAEANIRDLKIKDLKKKMKILEWH